MFWVPWGDRGEMVLPAWPGQWQSWCFLNGSVFSSAYSSAHGEGRGM